MASRRKVDIKPSLHKGYCHRCDDITWYDRGIPPSHWVHAMLTVFTLGLWLIVWIYVTLQYAQRIGECIYCEDERQNQLYLQESPNKNRFHDFKRRVEADGRRLRNPKDNG